MQCRERIGYAIEGERERACRASENPEQREERLQKRRIRDRTRHAAQTAQRRGADLQPTMRDWLLRLLRRERPGYSLTEYW